MDSRLDTSHRIASESPVHAASESAICNAAHPEVQSINHVEVICSSYLELLCLCFFFLCLCLFFFFLCFFFFLAFFLAFFCQQFARQLRPMFWSIQANSLVNLGQLFSQFRPFSHLLGFLLRGLAANFAFRPLFSAQIAPKCTPFFGEEGGKTS